MLLRSLGVCWLVLALVSGTAANARGVGGLSIEDVLKLCEAENDVVQAFWTKKIVGPGIQVGLSFAADWREPGVEAGPLPAGFLQGTSENLAGTPVRIGLYQGSDFPLRAENRFKGVELAAFLRIKMVNEPQFFFAKDTNLYTAMFPSVAVAEPCVSCHNQDESSPKRDWQLGDVMGATTWTYPAKTVAPEDFIGIVQTLRQAVRANYASYLDKVRTFGNPPEIGDKWPSEGYYLPNVDVFMVAISELIPTLDSLALDG
ncbi:MAG: c-type heme family protein [Geminicoccaceae bacterium]